MADPRNGGRYPEMCRLSCTLVTSTPPKIPLPGADFWGLQNPYAKIRKFLTGVRYFLNLVYCVYWLPCTIFFCIHLIYILINIRLSAIDGITYLVACHYSLIALFSVVFCVLIYVANKLFLSVFQTWSKSVQDKCPKGRVAGLLARENKTKHVLAAFGGTRWRFPHFCASAHCGPTHIPGFSQIRLGLGSYNRKTCDHPKWF